MRMFSGRMRYAPTVNSFIFTNLTKLFYYEEEKHLGDCDSDFDYDSYRYRDFIGSDQLHVRQWIINNEQLIAAGGNTFRY